MSLTNIDKDHANELILSINKQNIGHNTLEVVKANYMQYSKLKYIAKQMEQLKKEAEEVICDSFHQHRLQKVDCKSKKISGSTYHLYLDKNEKEYFSIVGPKQWGPSFKHTFVGSYYYDYDKTFERITE
jgi:hypothetical protein